MAPSPTDAAHTMSATSLRLAIRGIPTAHAQALRHGGPDAHGQLPLRAVAQGPGNPCRHCLQLIREGD